MPEGKTTPPIAQEQQSPESDENASIANISDLFEANSKGVEAMVKSGEVMFSAIESVGREIIDFTDKRMRALTDTTQSVVRCATWAEAYELQAKHARSAVEAYATEARTLLELSAKATKDGLGPLEQHTRSSLRR